MTLHLVYSITDSENKFVASLIITFNTENYMLNESERILKELKDLFSPNEVYFISGTNLRSC